MVLTNGRVFWTEYCRACPRFYFEFQSGLHLARDNQAQRIWQARLPIRFELTDSTVGILGFGDIDPKWRKGSVDLTARLWDLGSIQRRVPMPRLCTVWIVLPNVSVTSITWYVHSLKRRPPGLVNRDHLDNSPDMPLSLTWGGSLIPSEDLIWPSRKGGSPGLG